MKKLILLMAVAMTVLVGCKKDEAYDPNAPMSEQIIGTWNPTHVYSEKIGGWVSVDAIEYADYDDTYVQFNADNSYVLTQDDDYAAQGTYVITDKHIACTINAITVYYDIITIDAHTAQFDVYYDPTIKVRMKARR